MSTIIRKISVGKDYPNGVIHYQVGKDVSLNGIQYTIVLIQEDAKARDLKRHCYDIFISRGGSEGSLLWKSIIDVPVIVENNIDFE